MTPLPGFTAQPAAAPTVRSTLAVVMMTKDEAHRLATCLDRVRGWADEIVIIDDLSTDGTVEVARRYTDRIFSMASEDDHCRQWNRGIERAASDWILHIDADEWVTPELKRAIDAILLDDDGHSAFEIMRLNYFLGRPMRHGGWHHRHRILFRRDRARCVGRGIHSGARMQIDGTTGFLDADIEHYPFSSIAQFLERQNRYTSVEAAIAAAEQPAVLGRTIWYHTAWRPLKLFWKTYVKKQGCRDGWHGLVFSILFAWVHFLEWAKYWELCANQAASGSAPPSITTFVEGKNGETTAHARILVEHRTRIPPVTLASRILWRPVRQWVDAAMTPGRFEEARGLVRTQLEAWGELLLWCKYWEFTRVGRPVEQQPVAVDRASTVALGSSLTR